MTDTNLQHVLDYWIGDAASDPAIAKASNKRWYISSAANDEALREQFGTLLSAAEQGQLQAWQQTPQGSLALIILLDQFSRNLYRGQARAFSNDADALRIAEAMLAEQHLALSSIERTFAYHPFMHSENLAAQQQSIALFQALCDEALPEWQDQMENFLKHAIEHHDIIARFGRFPHRNQVLERADTTEEIEFLQNARRFGQ